MIRCTHVGGNADSPCRVSGRIQRSLSGTAATFLAPVTVSWMTWWTHSQRGGMVAVVALLVAGWLWLLLFVREERVEAA